MKLSLNWANWHSNIDLRDQPVEKIVDKIGSQLGEVEEVVDYGSKYQGIVVVKVVKCVKHPNADKLSLCLVDDGGVVKGVKRDKSRLVQVVCGAANVREGMLAAWIPPGAVVPTSSSNEPFVLEAREIRGQLSNGMLASASELDVNDDHNGILEIDAKKAGHETVKPGTPMSKLYGLDDVVIDIENKMFTHRPDCFGVLGLARELAGINDRKFKSPDWYLEVPELRNADGLELEVKNQVHSLVPRFMAVCVDNVSVKPSPIWLQAGLRRVGIKPINNVVDITNYLMYLTGQPLHAYDYDKVAALSNTKATLMARAAKASEKLKLLNGKTVELDEGAVVIATDKKPIGIAGIIGGSETEVDDKTSRIIIECATFDMYSIRRTSMNYGLFTDAVTRFGKGQSWLQNDRVINKAVGLIQTQAGGEQASNFIDICHQDREIIGRQTIHDPVRVEADFINQRLGLDLSDQQIAKLLKNTEFICEIIKGGILIVKAPFWRTDISIREDIVEEVGRLYGYDDLPQELPRRLSEPAKVEAGISVKSRLRHALASLGANETLNYSFVHGQVLENSMQDPKDSYKITSALSPDLQYYRQSLMPSLLSRVHPNVKAGYDEFALFEINKTHNKKHGLNAEKVPVEIEMTGLVYANKSSKKPGFFAARAYLDQLAGLLGVELRYDSVGSDADYSVTRPYDFERSALVSVKQSDIFLGIIGEFKAEVKQNFKLPFCSGGFEIDTTKIIEAIKRDDNSRYIPASKYPAIYQDICLEVSEAVKYAAVYDALGGVLQKNAAGDVSTKLRLLDIFVPKPGKKRLTFNITLVSYQRTLSQPDVARIIEKASQHLSSKLGARTV